MVSVIKSNSIFDLVGMIGALLGVSMPIFWMVLILNYALAVNSKTLPMLTTLFINWVFVGEARGHNSGLGLKHSKKRIRAKGKSLLRELSTTDV